MATIPLMLTVLEGGVCSFRDMVTKFDKAWKNIIYSFFYK